MSEPASRNNWLVGVTVGVLLLRISVLRPFAHDSYSAGNDMLVASSRKQHKGKLLSCRAFQEYVKSYKVFVSNGFPRLAGYKEQFFIEIFKGQKGTELS